MAVPVIHDEFAELKNMQAFAISSGVPILFMGMDFATAFISFLDP
jgi:1,4-alpha-glucan branching enzyme